MSAIIIGATGLVGQSIVKAVEQSAHISKLISLGRREGSLTDPKVHTVVEKDSDKWPSIVAEQTNLKYAFSAFGTTRAAAGGAENFKKIDYGINYDFAKAAKDAGVETFVLVSSGGADSKSLFLYMQVKGKLEDDIVALKFPRTIILSPAILLGERELSKGIAASVFEFIGLHTHTVPFLNKYSNFGHDVAKYAVHLAEQPLPTGTEPVVHYATSQEINAFSKKP